MHLIKLHRLYLQILAGQVHLKIFRGTINWVLSQKHLFTIRGYFSLKVAIWFVFPAGLYIAFLRICKEAYVSRLLQIWRA